MTPYARSVIAVVCLVMGFALLLLAATRNDPQIAVYGTALTGPVLGYAFGDRNGEKRAASALAERGLDPAVFSLLEQAVRPKDATSSSSSSSTPAPPASSAVE